MNFTPLEHEGKDVAKTVLTTAENDQQKGQIRLFSRRDETKRGDVLKQHKSSAKNNGKMTFFLLNKAYLYSKYEFPLVKYFSRKVYGH